MAVVLSSLSLAVVTCGDDGDVSPASRVSAKELTPCTGECSEPLGMAAWGFGWLVKASDPWGPSQPRVFHDSGSTQLLRAPQDSQGTKCCFGDSSNKALCGELSLWLLPHWEQHREKSPNFGLNHAIFNNVPNSSV